MQFLLENVGYKYRSRRLANLLSSDKAKKNGDPDFHFFPESHKAVYEFWLQQENAIMSTDRRSGRDVSHF